MSQHGQAHQRATAGDRGDDDPPSSRSVLQAMARIEEDLLDDPDPSVGSEATPPPSSASSDSVSTSLSSEGKGDTAHEGDNDAEGTEKAPSELLRKQAQAAGPSPLEPDLGSSLRDPSTRSLVSARPFRPQHRPPTPVLQVLDDDQTGAESVRLRNRSLTLGRLHGDLVFSHEKLMSKQHAEIRREGAPGEYRWVLQDLDSRNGSFIRRKEVTLGNRTRFWIGKSLIKASIADESAELTLTEIAQGEAERISLEPGSYSIGQDAQECVDFLRLSPFLDRNHLRLEHKQHGQWMLTDLDSTNGLWVAIDKQAVELSHGDAFQLGEQRFLFTIP